MTGDRRPLARSLAWYNEVDPYAAQWLRNLVSAGHIAPGDVDERDIRSIPADDVKGYRQCHFFAGIGGWSVALRLAGWPDDRPVWTGSCPCQPFSTAGAGKAADDERHLWPAWSSLIAECRPGTVFGEQVEAAVGWGWLDAVFTDLEAEGYACGSAVLPACGVGAPHIRQRLWFVADDSAARGVGHANSGDAAQERAGDDVFREQRAALRRRAVVVAGAGAASRNGGGPRASRTAGGTHGRDPATAGARGVADADGGDASAEGLQRGGEQRLESQDSGARLLANTDAAGQRKLGRGGLLDGERQAFGNDADGRGARFLGDASPQGLPPCEREAVVGSGRRIEGRATQQPSGPLGFWSDAIWLPCTDGKARPAQSRFQPLAHGVQRRPSKLRAYGNAIVPQVAAELIAAFMAARP